MKICTLIPHHRCNTWSDQIVCDDYSSRCISVEFDAIWANTEAEQRARHILLTTKQNANQGLFVWPSVFILSCHFLILRALSHRQLILMSCLFPSPFLYISPLPVWHIICFTSIWKSKPVSIFFHLLDVVVGEKPCDAGGGNDLMDRIIRQEGKKEGAQRKGKGTWKWGRLGDGLR